MDVMTIDIHTLSYM